MITKTITEVELQGGGRVFIGSMPVRDVVSIEGSVYGGWNMLPEPQSEVPLLAAELLDAGTKTKSKNQIRGTLSALGATLIFSASGERMRFSASCFPEDFAKVLAIIVECLSEATFPETELKALKARVLGELAEEATDTKAQAGIALAQSLYDNAHANWIDDTKTRTKKVNAVTRKQVQAFGNMLGRGGLILSVVGDVETNNLLPIIEKAVRKLGVGSLAPSEQRPNQKKHQVVENRISIKDKANIDVYLGASVPLTYTSPSFVPFMTLAGMLGGRGLSTGHLMRTIRERDGYTYGIYAMPDGFDGGTDGYFLIWATFSPATFEKALAATRNEIATFLAGGITEDALTRKKSEMIGRYLLGLSTTRGRARALHAIAAEGKSLSYLDEYPELVRALTIDDINAVARILPLTKLAVTAAGSFIDKKY